MTRTACFGDRSFVSGGSASLPSRKKSSLWHRSGAFRIAASSGGGDMGPALIADLIRRRYALPMSLTPEQILAASAADVAAAVRACAVSDVLDFSRPSVATYVDDAGVMHTVPANVPRITPQGLLSEGAGQNLIQNAEFTGALIGAVPDKWRVDSSSSGLTISVTGVGVEKGRSYIDVRWHGVLSNTVIRYPTFAISNNARPSAAAGQTFGLRAGYRLVAGALPPSPHRISLEIQEISSAPLYLNGAVKNVIPTPEYAEADVSRTFTNAATVNAHAAVFLTVQPNTGDAIDFTLRFYCWQLEKAEAMSSYIPTTGSVMTRAADRCRLTPRARAVLARASAGMIVQGAAIQGSNGRIVGGRDSRVVGLNIPQTAMQLGDINVVAIGAAATPTPAFGVAAGWDAAGKAGSYQSAPVASHGLPLDADLTEIYLGRDSGGTYANGYIQALIGYPARPANAALPGKAIPYV